MNLIKRSKNPLTQAFINAIAGILLFLGSFNQDDQSMRLGGLAIGIALMLMALRQSVLAFEALSGQATDRS